MPIRHALLAILVVVIWGSNFIAIKLSVEAMPPILAAAFRFLLAAFPAIVFVKPPKTEWYWVLGFGLTFSFALYGFLNLSLYFGLPAGLASVLLQTQAFFTMAIAFAVLKERPRRMQILGAVIAFCGVALIAWQRVAVVSVLPIALVLLAALSWGSANVTAKKAGPVNPVALAVWGSACGVPPLFILSLLVEGPASFMNVVTHPTLDMVGLTVFMAYPASLFGLAAWNFLLARYPASIVAPFALLSPVASLILGWLILNETASLIELFGGALVLAGLAATVYKPRNVYKHQIKSY